MCACLQIGDPLPQRHEEHADPTVQRITGWIDGDTLADELHRFQSTHVGPTPIATRIYGFCGLDRA
jgi:hypothetical protein